MRTLKVYFALLIAIGSMMSCSKDDEPQTPDTPEQQENQNPSIELLTPIDGTILDAGTTEYSFTWKGTDTDNDALTYNIYIGQTLPETPTAQDLTNTSYQFTGLTDGTSYQWKVVVHDGTVSIESPVQTFQVKEAEIKGVILEWQDVNASAYDLYFGENSASEKIASNVTERKYLFQGLEIGKKYHYRLHAKGSDHEFTEHYFIYQEEGVKIFDGNVFLDNQERIRKFGGRGFSEVTGDLDIEQNFRRDIRELGWLSSITKVGSIYLKYVDGLESLYGLHNISIISGSLFISNLPSLKNISLDELLVIGGSLSFYENKILETISVQKLAVIGGGLYLRHNPLLSSVASDNLTNIWGNVEIEGNESLVDLNFLRKLKGVYQDLVIWENDALTDISALSNFTFIAQSFKLIDNDALKSSAGLENISIVSFEMLIRGNDLLEDIQMQKLDTAGEIDISHNPKIQELSGLNKLRNVAIKVSIYQNTTLSDFCGLQELYIYGGGFETYINGNAYNPNSWQITNGYCRQ